MVEEGVARTVKGWIESAKKVAVLTHTNPDGDAIGSSLGLALALGNRRAPSCPDCHRAHRILGPDSPDSSVHGEALAGTCGSGAISSRPGGRCHGELSPKSVAGAAMAFSPRGKFAGGVGWIFSVGYWALLLALAVRVVFGLARKK